VVRHYWFSAGSPNCSTDLYVIVNGDFTGVYNRDYILEAFVHSYAGVVGQDFVLMNEKPCPHCASLSTLSAKEIKRMDWPAPSPDVNLMLIQHSMYGTYSNDGSLHGQLNHNPGRTSHKRSFRSGQEFLVRSFSCMCIVVLDVTRRDI